MSKYELSVSCRMMKNKDVFSKSDPICILSKAKKGSNDWTEIGRTEILKNTQFPSWKTKFILDKDKLDGDKLKFAVFDCDRGKVKGSFGSVTAGLDDIIKARGMKLEGPLEKGVGIVVMAEIATEDPNVVTFQFSGKKLKKMDTFSKSDPYFILTRLTLNNETTPVYRSKYIKNTLNPDWETFAISARQLCNGDYNRPISMFVFDKDHGTDDFIGSFTTTLQELKTAKESGKAKKGFIITDMKDKATGSIFLEEMVIREVPNFVDKHEQ